MMSWVADRFGNILKTQETPECQLPKLKVAGPNPVSRSNKNIGLWLKCCNPFCLLSIELFNAKKPRFVRGFFVRLIDTNPTAF